MSTRRAAVYVRISQDRTGQRAGVARQLEDCERLAANNGWTVVDVFEDNDVSARSRTRPEYLRLVDAVERGDIDAVVAWHPDRLYRRLVDLEALVDLIERKRVDVVTVQAGKVDLSTASGRFTARVIGSAAAYESEVKGERITRAAEQRARAGKFSGGMRPYGYAADGVTVVDREAIVVRAVVADLGAGVSLREATRRVVERGALTVTGTPWTPARMRNYLLSPRVAGIATYKGAEIGPASWPALVPEGAWRSVKALLTDPSRTTTPGATPRHLLSGITVCGRCGKRCRVSSGRRMRNGEPRRQYRCPHGHVVRDKAALEQWVIDATMALLDRDEVHVVAPAEPHDTTVAEAAEIRQRLAALATDYADGVLTREQMVGGTGRLRARLEQVEATQRARVRTSALSALQGGDVRAAWERLDVARQRAIMRELWEVRLNPMPTGRSGVNEQGVTLAPVWEQS